MVDFIKRIREVALKLSPFCLGIDPTEAILKRWCLEDSMNGLKKFCKIIKEAIVENNLKKVGIIKPQAAFFERFGSGGIREMSKLICYAKENDILTILDCKRADVGHTAHAYIDAILGCMGADAMTFNPYLGIEVFDSQLLEKVYKNDAFVFIVIKSSNPEGKMIQDARVDDGRTVAEYLADKINECNEKLSLGNRVKLLGAVVGATLKREEIKTILPRLNNTLILSPGIGAQGASYQDLVDNFGKYSIDVIPTSSRGVLAKGPGVNDLRKAICEEMEKAIVKIHKDHL